MNTELIKKKILDLAIRGKLVEQRPEDGTAEELYSQIQEEKKKLIVDGKIKKEKPLPEISEDEIRFDIPKSWKWVRLGEVGSWASGATPSRLNLDYYGGNIPWLKTGDLTDSFIDEVSEYITEKALKNTSVRLNPVGSVLIAMYGATIGKLGILNIPSTTNQACCACICYGGIFNKYLFYYLFGMKSFFINKAMGGAQPNISKEKIVNSLLPLPPLAEQKRIVDKVVEIFSRIDVIEKAKADLAKDGNLLEKKFLDLAIRGKLVDQRPEEGTAEDLYNQIREEKKKLIAEGKIKKEKPLPEITEDEIPFDIPESWKWVRLGDIGSWSAGATPSRLNHEFYGGDIPWLKTGDLNDSFIDNIPEFITNIALKKTSVRLNPVGSVLIAMYGATIGKLGILKVPATTNQACCACICFNGVFNKYLFYYLLARRSSFIWQAMGGAQPNISKEKIVCSLFAIPPLAEQKRIVKKIEELLPYCYKLKE